MKPAKDEWNCGTAAEDEGLAADEKDDAAKRDESERRAARADVEKSEPRGVSSK